MFGSDKTKSVVVTGASTGIGRATAVTLASHGFRVFAGVRQGRDVTSIQSEGLSNLSAILIDVTELAMIERAVAEVELEVGQLGLAGLVNNAGVSCGGPFEYVDLQDVRDCFEVNFFGVLNVTRAFLPLLRCGRGRIVNMSSGVGRVAPPLVGPYSSSKFALEAMSDVLRVELRRSNIAVSVVEPGFVSTPLLHKGDVQTSRQREALPADAPPYYRGAMFKLREQFENGRSIAPEVVAKVVLRALTASRPRSRYPVGAEAWMLLMLRRCLPDRLLDQILGRMVDL